MRTGFLVRSSNVPLVDVQSGWVWVKRAVGWFTRVWVLGGWGRVFVWSSNVRLANVGSWSGHVQQPKPKA